MNSAQALRMLVLVTVGLPYLAVKGLVLLARKAWQAIVIHRGLQILLSVLLLLLLLGAWKFGPLVTGRLALLSRAETLARTSNGRNTLDMENDLRRRAFRLGFKGAIRQRDAVSIERAHSDGITLCTIAFEFRREVNIFGLWRREIMVSGKVEEPAEPPEEQGKSLEDMLVR